MQKLTIKKTDLSISALCMGGCPLGGYGWGDTQRDDLINAVKTAVESGCPVIVSGSLYLAGTALKDCASLDSVLNI